MKQPKKKSTYVKPEVEVYELDPEESILGASPSGHDNGNHNGWNNPNNPHHGDSHSIWGN